MIGIYKITSPSGRIYIGQTSSIAKRRTQYEGLRCKSQPRLYASLIKYGFSEHIFEAIEECSVEDLNTRERHWQDLYDVIGEMGLNCLLTETAEKPRVCSQETRKKLSENNTRYNKGTKLSEQHRGSISRALTGHVQTEEHIAKRSKALKGRTIPEEVKRKKTETVTGKKRGPYSKRLV